MMQANDEGGDGTLIKRSMRIDGHRTSLALEREFWSALELIAYAQKRSLPALVATIDREREHQRPQASLASAARIFALEHAPPPPTARLSGC